jgi:hypothetical protein
MPDTKTCDGKHHRLQAATQIALGDISVYQHVYCSPFDDGTKQYGPRTYVWYCVG